MVYAACCKLWARAGLSHVKRAAFFSLPPCGGGPGWGITPSPCASSPPPRPLPAGGREVRESAARESHSRPSSIALLVSFLDRLGGRLRRHAAAGDFGGDVVDHAPDRGAEALVTKILMIFRSRQILRDVA